MIDSGIFAFLPKVIAMATFDVTGHRNANRFRYLLDGSQRIVHFHLDSEASSWNVIGNDGYLKLYFFALDIDVSRRVSLSRVSSTG